MEKINVLEIVKEYKKSHDLSEIYQKIEIKEYVPFLYKKGAIDAIIDTFLQTEYGLYVYDALDKHLAFVLGFITLYTNLDYEDEEGYAAYDALVESHLLDHIIDKVGYDYSDFVNFFEETLKNKIETNNSIPNVLNGFLTGLSAAVSNLDAKKLGTVLENLNS